MVKKMLVTATFREFDYDFVFSNTEQEGEIPEGYIQDFIFEETSGKDEVIYFICDEGSLCDFSKPYSDLDKVVEELKW
tara:strand:- start:162 stop:395 length:234 start_codon:yes stop_codon:yes gene_type:complete